MGQGLHTKIIQIAAQKFGIADSMVEVVETATNVVANGQPTGARDGHCHLFSTTHTYIHIHTQKHTCTHSHTHTHTRTQIHTPPAYQHTYNDYVVYY